MFLLRYYFANNPLTAFLLTLVKAFSNYAYTTFYYTTLYYTLTTHNYTQNSLLSKPSLKLSKHTFKLTLPPIKHPTLFNKLML